MANLISYILSIPIPSFMHHQYLKQILDITIIALSTQSLDLLIHLSHLLIHLSPFLYTACLEMFSFFQKQMYILQYPLEILVVNFLSSCLFENVSNLGVFSRKLVQSSS